MAKPKPKVDAADGPTQADTPAAGGPARHWLVRLSVPGSAVLDVVAPSADDARAIVLAAVAAGCTVSEV